MAMKKSIFPPNEINWAVICLGVCTCDEGFAEADCSVNLHAPPVITGTARGGICDTGIRACRAIPVYGKNFLDSPNITCRVTVEQVCFVKVFLQKNLYILKNDFFL